MRAFLFCAVSTALLCASVSKAENSCKKDGAELEVVGKTEKEKKGDCEKNGGTWEKKKKEKPKEEVKAGGGGW